MAAVLQALEKDMRDLRRGVRRKLRLVPEAQLPGLPARSVLLDLLRADRLHLRLTEDEYAERHGVSQRTFRRFRQGQGKFPKLLRLSLLGQHPRWQRTLDAVVVEDAHRDAGAADAE